MLTNKNGTKQNLSIQIKIEEIDRERDEKMIN
jgi:hypothetical protein